MLERDWSGTFCEPWDENTYRFWRSLSRARSSIRMRATIGICSSPSRSVDTW